DEGTRRAAGRSAPGPDRPPRRQLQPGPRRAPARGRAGVGGARIGPGLAAGLARQPVEAVPRHGALRGAARLGAADRGRPARGRHGDRGAARHPLHRRHPGAVAGALPARPLRAAARGRQPPATAALAALAGDRADHAHRGGAAAGRHAAGARRAGGAAAGAPPASPRGLVPRKARGTCPLVLDPRAGASGLGHRHPSALRRAAL
ncbi:MAG: Nicotinate-nucleotide adenylyltransferase, partial [uncultured Acetobacteraceae bacterium]